MNKELFIFKFNNHTKFIIQLHHPNDKIEASYETQFYFKNYNHQYFIAYNFIRSNIADLQNLLNKALKNQLEFNEFFNHDIGYYWNLYLNKKNNSNNDYSILSKYLIFDSLLPTFIYNDINGNIFITIIPLYPHIHSRKKRRPTDGHFLTWIKSYKPLYKTILPRNIAEQWLIQAQQILDTIDENTQMLHEQGKL